MIDIIITFGFLASAITANKIVLTYMSPILLVAIRMLIAGLLLIIYNLWSCKFKSNIKNLLSNFFNLLVVTLCTTLIPSLLKAYALKNMLSAKAAFFGILDPFVTSILAYYILQERLTSQKIIGILIGFLGAFVLIVSQFKDISINNFLIQSSYELAAIIAVIVGRFGWIIAQKLLKQNVFSSTELNSYTMLLSGIMSFGFGYAFDLLHLFNFNLNMCVWLLYTIIIGNLFAYNLYANLLKKHTATLLSLSSFLVPIFVQIFGYLFLSEPLSINLFISMFITLIGLIVFVFK